MSESDEPRDLLQLPIIPLRAINAYPGSTLVIRAGRPGTLDAIKHAMDGDRTVLALMQTEDTAEVTPDGLRQVGVRCRIEQIEPMPDSLQVALYGVERVSVIRVEQRGKRLAGLVRPRPDAPLADPEDPTLLGLAREVRERAVEAAGLAGAPVEALSAHFEGCEAPGELADQVAAALELEAEDRQRLLETDDPQARLREVLVLLLRQLAVLRAQREVHDKVQEELGDRQREMVLREQLKAIRSELGDDEDEGDLDELKARLAELELPEEARREVDRELRRLSRSQGPEQAVIRTFLETVADLPWDTRSEDHLDLARAAEVLEQHHFGLPEVKERVLEFLAVRKLRLERKQTRRVQRPLPDDEPPSRASGRLAAAAAPEPERREGEAAPILLFAGPPGVGKTSIAQAIAAAMGRKYLRISLGGVRDEADVRGHRRTYVGALPGRLIAGLRQAGTRNPVILLDEIDKLGRGVQGDPSAALLEVLDPAQNHRFTDHYLGVPFDLSEVVFIATANVVEQIPAPLLDRMERIDFRGYTEQEKTEIATRHLLDRQREAHGLRFDELVLEPEALLEVVRRYTREAGVRGLARELKKIARKQAHKVALAGPGLSGGQPPLDVAAVRELLGKPRVHPERAFESPQVGVAAGMYYTPAGGDVMFLEVGRMRGKGQLTLTGQLGDVMRESARAALSWARANADALGIASASFNSDLHLHAPAGAIPKDGPSAGVAIASAIVSSLTGAPVRHDVAMTGEITLSGRVLPVGGIKEKLLGAHRAGVRTILIPRDNLADLDDLPSEARDELSIIAVDRIEEALEVSLLRPPQATLGTLGWTPSRLLSEALVDPSH